ncbi:MAG: hypothetical protein FJW14_09375 [Acidimicrobiia bacterium]|nr:hypothetical protein [Acidimicrobiia bacterium]
MADQLDRVLQGLDEAQQFAATYRFEMTSEYRALIECVEAMSGNQSGGDKSSVWPAMRRYVESITRARRV